MNVGCNKDYESGWGWNRAEFQPLLFILCVTLKRRLKFRLCSRRWKKQRKEKSTTSIWRLQSKAFSKGLYKPAFVTEKSPTKANFIFTVAFLDGQKLCIEGWKWLKGTAVLIKSGRLVVNSFLLMNKVKLLEKEIVKDWVFHRVRF